MSIEYNPVGVSCNLSCSYCLAPGTPVLLTDGQWKPIEKVLVGDELVSFEDSPQKGNKRRFVDTVVKGRIYKKDKLYRIHTDLGHIDCTEDHEWLVNRWDHQYKLQLKDMRPGDLLYWLAEPVSEDITEQHDYRIGWLAGMTAGDGTHGDYVNADKSTISSFKIYSTEQEILDRAVQYTREEIGIALRQVDVPRIQNDRIVDLKYVHFTKRQAEDLDLIRSYVLKEPEGQSIEFLKGWIAGFFDAEGTKASLRINRKSESMIDRAAWVWAQLGFSTKKTRRSDDMWQLFVHGGKETTIRFASMCRPALKRKVSIDGVQINRTKKVAITKIEPLEGTHDVYDVETESLTFIANGFLTWDCYEHPLRDAGNIKKPLDVDKVKQALEAEGGQFTIFGGEPLLAPIDHLEEMWQWGYEKYKSNGIQSNGVLITDEHIELFKKYKVQPGISLDGPDELNDSRWRGTLDATRKATQKTLDNIGKLIDNGIIPSLIITLYQGNVRDGRLQRLKEWMVELDHKGIYSVRIHLLEVDHEEVKKTMALTAEENYQAMIELHDLESELQRMRFDIFGDIRKMLKGDDASVTCIWNNCDPYTTAAVRGVDANGDQHNCGRTNKDGVNWHKASVASYERQIALYHTPWKYHGCKGCRFFVMCGGQCPGTGENFDWRNKSDNCWVWYKLMEHMEADMLAKGEKPVSLHPQLRKIEQIMLSELAAGRRTNIVSALRVLNSQNRSNGRQVTQENHSDAHGDGATTTRRYDNHGDSHGDSAHADNSGHTDTYK